jgi:hypothetical protein
MNVAKLILSAVICLGVAGAMATGCGSSSGGPGPVVDSGSGHDGSLDGADDAGGKSCNPFVAGDLCPQGQTCCFSGLRGTCTDVGSCSSPFQISCVNTATCGGTVCCGSVQLPAGFDASAFAADASFDAAAFDASDFDASGFGLTLACASSCVAPQFQICMTNQDCPSGQVCGGPMMMASNMVPGFILACFPADAGLPPVPDASPEGGPADATSGAGD